MAFDGVGYDDFALVYPRAYAPGSTLTGDALATPLRTGYSYARNHGRMVIDQHWTMPFRSPANFRSLANFASTAYVRVAEGRRYIHSQVTHLVCEATFAAPAVPPPGALVYHRLRVTDGTNIDTGTVTTRVEAQQFHGPFAGVTQSTVTGNWQPSTTGGSYPRVRVALVTPADAFSVYSWQGRSVARLDVKLDTVATSAARLVTLDAYAVQVDDSSHARAYVPMHVAVWTEIRG